MLAMPLSSMTIFDFISVHQLSPLSPEEAKDVPPYGLVLGLGASTVYTNHDSIWVAVENDGSLFRVRFDSLSYGGPKAEHHPTLANFGKAEEKTG
jgi:hypothetical protein